MKHDRRPYHRQGDSIWREPWDNNVLAFAVRISAYLHERWRTERIESSAEACTAIVPNGVLCSLAGTHEMRTARARCVALSAHVGLTITAFDAHRMQISWPKWADFQGLDEYRAGRTPAKPRQSASSVQNQRPEEEEKTKSARPSRAASRCPDQLEPGEWERLEAWCLAKHPGLLIELPDLWDRVVSWARSKNVQRSSWYAQAQTFVLRRAKEKSDGPQRSFQSNGRRLTAVEAARNIRDRLGLDRETADVREAIHVVPALGNPRH